MGSKPPAASVVRFLLTAVLATASVSALARSDPQCDESAVRVEPNTGLVRVAPTGVDDTENLQCALDLAIARRIAEVRLEAATYFTGDIYVSDFRGTLAGTGMDETEIRIKERAVHCKLQEDEDRISAAIKFASGAPTVRFLAITLDADPCVRPNFELRTILAFTGRHSGTDCFADTSFGTVDRVRILDSYREPDDPGFQRKGGNSAIFVAGEPRVGGTCTNRLTGSFRLNKSIIDAPIGVRALMRGMSQMDIRNNEFRTDWIGINLLHRVSQATYVVGNSFSTRAGAPSPEEPDHPHTLACQVCFWALQDVDNQIVIHQNIFDQRNDPAPAEMAAIDAWSNARTTMTITENTFFQSAAPDRMESISIVAVDGGQIARNSFDTGPGVVLFVTEQWAIMANAFAEPADPNEEPHIFLHGSTRENVVGAGQTDRVRDDGADNAVL